MSLLAIPGTTSRRAQPMHDPAEILERLASVRHLNSPIPKTERADAFPFNRYPAMFYWVPRDSNPGPFDYESSALTAELGTHPRVNTRGVTLLSTLFFELAQQERSIPQ